MRGNNVMKGYYEQPEATAEAFRGGWFHSGDLAVWHPDGYIELRDRKKDIIISGGENISTIEVEQAVAQHPAVLECAVVADPRREVGRASQGVRDAQAGRQATEAEIIELLPAAHRPLQVPGGDRVRRPAQDLDRQGPEVRAARQGVGRPGEADQLTLPRRAPGSDSAAVEVGELPPEPGQRVPRPPRAGSGLAAARRAGAGRGPRARRWCAGASSAGARCGGPSRGAGAHAARAPPLRAA